MFHNGREFALRRGQRDDLTDSAPDPDVCPGASRTDRRPPASCCDNGRSCWRDLEAGTGIDLVGCCKRCGAAQRRRIWPYDLGDDAVATERKLPGTMQRGLVKFGSCMRWADHRRVLPCMHWFVASAAAIALFSWPAHGQSLQLPNPSRTVFKCDVAGTVVYSDDPCLGAKRIDVEPTRGLDRASGRRSVGRDVLRETTREQYVKAVKPLTGLTTDQYAVTARRMDLSSAAKAECVSLDAGIADAEVIERSASAGARTAVQHDLFKLRKRYRDIGC